MNAKKTIRKILFIAFWLCIGGGMLTLLLAAIRKKNNGMCKGYTITISGGEKNRFIDEKDVEQMMLKAAGGNIKGQSVASISLNQLEQTMKENVWISKAELYFDNQDELNISVTEREPVARIFTTEGSSFYIDSAGNKLPLSDKLSARVPVFTGFPAKKLITKKDSILLNDVKRTAVFILNDNFWMSQVSQVDITADRAFEMIPVVGNHVVKLGRGDDIEKKFRRLMVFYQQVLSKTGFDKYRSVDVQYAGQVVASKYGADVKVDSAQLRRNVEKLLRASGGNGNDTTIQSPAVINRANAEVEERGATDNDAADKPAEQNANSNSGRNESRPGEARQPRAVMPRRVNN